MHLNGAGHRRILPYHHGIKLLVEEVLHILRCDGGQEKELSSPPPASEIIKNHQVVKIWGIQVIFSE